MPEWPKGHDWKSCVPKGTEGSNPSLSSIESGVSRSPSASSCTPSPPPAARGEATLLVLARCAWRSHAALVPARCEPLSRAGDEVLRPLGDVVGRGDVLEGEAEGGEARVAAADADLHADHPDQGSLGG